ncbi:MAG: hypothetical protein ACTSUN_02740 [Promethearchaeota archaeon]
MSAKSALEVFLNKLYHLSELIAFKKMEKKGMVHGTIQDILAYFEIITMDERERLNHLSALQKSIKKENFYKILKDNFNFLLKLHDRIKKIIQDEFQLKHFY